MGSVFTTSERLEIRRGRLWRIITAHGIGRKMDAKLDIAEICEDGTKRCRNLERSFYGFYKVAFPGYTYGYGPYKYVAEIDDWYETDENVQNLSTELPSGSDRELIKETYPHFKYIVDKFPMSTRGYFKLLPIWKAHPEVEYMLGAGYYQIAFNRSLWNLSESKRAEVLQWLRTNPEIHNPALVEVLTCIKYRIGWEEMEKFEERPLYGTGWGCVRVNYPEWKYISLLKGDYISNARMYDDYRNMCKRAGHSFKEPYWRFPKSLKRFHDKVMKECRLIAQAEEAARIERERVLKEEQKKNRNSIYRKFCKMMEKFADRKLSNGKMSVFIPDSVELVKKQAEKLKQCLISCDYISRVVQHKCLLVFIYKDKKPYATAELIKRGKDYVIGQFYGNERLKNCEAKPDARNSLDLWAKQNMFKIVA